MIKFSVVIPLYNGAAFIETTLASILRQTLLPTEIVVIDDGSTDLGPQRVQSYPSELIRLIAQPNSGVSAARNKGILEAKNKYIAFIDADDTWEPNHLEVLADLIEKYPTCGVFGTSYYYCKPGEKPTLPILSTPLTFQEETGILTNYFMLASGTNPPLHISSWAVRKEAITSLGGFPPGIPAGEDVITLARLYANNDIAYSRMATSTYFLHPAKGKKPRPAKWHNPIDAMFNELLRTAKHRPYTRRYVSSWHKGRMVGALLGKQYRLAIREFLIAFSIFPFQRKLYTALAATIYAILTHRSLYELNQSLNPTQKQ